MNKNPRIAHAYCEVHPVDVPLKSSPRYEMHVRGQIFNRTNVHQLTNGQIIKSSPVRKVEREVSGRDVTKGNFTAGFLFQRAVYNFSRVLLLTSRPDKMRGN